MTFLLIEIYRLITINKIFALFTFCSYKELRTKHIISRNLQIPLFLFAPKDVVRSIFLIKYFPKFKTTLYFQLSRIKFFEVGGVHFERAMGTSSETHTLTYDHV